MADEPVNNPDENPANESGGSPPALSQLYDTLGGVQAGLDVRQQEADADKKTLLKQEQALLEQRQAAEDADDTEAYQQLTDQLEQLWEAWGALTADDEESDAAQPETEASVGQQDERDRDGDDRGASE